MKYVDYSFFRDFENSCDVVTLKPFKDTGRPYVTDIRQLRYNTGGTIDYNLTYKEENWETLRKNITLKHIQPMALYISPLKISSIKWQHLQILKATIPKDCHSFYDNLEYSKK